MTSSVFAVWLGMQCLSAVDVQKELDADRQHRLSLTVSIPRAVFYTAELTGELRLARKVGLAATIGAGWPGRLLGLELGASVRYYLVGSFIHGLQVGARVLASALVGRGATALEAGIAPFVGYKFTNNLGFTFELQLGPSVSAFSAGGEVVPRFGALIHANVGWSLLAL